MKTSVLDILRETVETPLPTRWGDWKYHHENYTLRLVKDGHWLYEIDLDRCATSAAILDWIFQVQEKTWATPRIVKDLLEAIRDILHPQANYCSFGLVHNYPGKKVDARKILDQLYGARR